MDYEQAANVWVEKDKSSVHMDHDNLKARINSFITGHNTGALATASGSFVRCTPIEYTFVDDAFYLLSEGGLKFKALKDNKHVAFAIYEPYSGFEMVKGLQVMGLASIVEPFTDEYLKILEFKKISVDFIKKLPQPLNLIKIEPYSYDYLDGDLKKDGFGIRQHLEECRVCGTG